MHSALLTCRRRLSLTRRSPVGISRDLASLRTTKSHPRVTLNGCPRARRSESIFPIKVRYISDTVELRRELNVALSSILTRVCFDRADMRHGQVESWSNEGLTDLFNRLIECNR